MSLQATVVSCQPGLVQMVRQDDMFECGKGVVVMWPDEGATFIPATGKNKYGINYLRDIIKQYNIKKGYKIEQAYFKLMCANNYDCVIIKL